MSENKKPEIITLSSKEVYKNRWMSVREDAIERADGSKGIYGVIEKKDFAVVVPIGPEGITLVEQYRYTVGERHWEFPQGSKEDTDLCSIDLAKAELCEETGLRAKKMEAIGELFTAYGYSNQRYFAFVATGLTKGERNLDPEEQGLISKTFPIAEVERMILCGEIKDSVTVAVFGLLKIRGVIM
ncbi:MAG TPA: NUDIX hydrolase [Treponemataceae bacterium]|nr:NUDIX hydrolase [Treponemataceae bacterium]